MLSVRPSRSLSAATSLAVCLFILLTPMTLLTSCASACRPVAQGGESLHYLLVGMDEAAANTDEMLLLSYCGDQQRLYLLQLPRDTCCEEGGATRKLNGVLPTAMAAGHSRAEALGQLCRVITETMRLPLDGYLALDAAALAAVVDALGGLEVQMPFALSFTGTDGVPLDISAGRAHLDGGQVMQLARHRQGYAMGDLARLDVQKLLLQGLLSRLRSCGPSQALSLLAVLQRRACSDIAAPELVRLLLVAKDSWREVEPAYATLPGVALLHRGVSYYVPHRVAATALLRRMGADGPFDPRGCLCLSDAPALRAAYEDTDATYRIYTDAGLLTLSPPA